MNIVVDSNVVISALIKNSTTRRIIVQCNDILLSPEMMIDEIKKHIDMISAKSGLAHRDIETILNILLRYVKLISFNEIKNFIPKAKIMMEKIDPNDIVFVATALSKNAAIWSDDKDFQKQDKIEVFTTKKMIKRML